MKRLLNSIAALLIICFMISCGDGDQSEKMQDVKAQKKIKNKIYKLAIIDAQDKEPYKSARLKMIQTLKDRGYEEGKNLKIYYATCGNNLNKGIELIDNMVKKAPDVIFLQGTIMVIAGRNSKYFNKPEYKFIFANVTDPVGIGVVHSMDEPPKYNFTGVSYPVPVESRLKFIKELIPNIKKIGLIYADMPQSHSYNKWVKDALIKDPSLKGIEVIFRKVPFVKGEEGSKKMAKLAKKFIIDLDKKVNVFLSPNDQMGVQEPFTRIVAKTATKPLIGLSYNDVMLQWGATATIFPSTITIGVQTAEIIIKVLNGEEIKNITPQWPREYGFAFNIKMVKKYGLRVPIKLIEMAGKNIIQ